MAHISHFYILHENHIKAVVALDKTEKIQRRHGNIYFGILASRFLFVISLLRESSTVWNRLCLYTLRYRYRRNYKIYNSKKHSNITRRKSINAQYFSDIFLLRLTVQIIINRIIFHNNNNNHNHNTKFLRRHNATDRGASHTNHYYIIIVEYYYHL